MEARTRSALVVGGTGLVGRELVDQLSRDARYASITSLTRRAVSAPSHVGTLLVSFDSLSTADLPRADDAYCCLGTTRRLAGSDRAFRRVDFDYVLAFAGAAQRAGVSRFLLVSSVGANRASRLLYPRVKGETEAALRQMGFEVLVILRPSFLLGVRNEVRLGEAAGIAIARALSPIFRGPLRRYRPVHASAVAAAMVAGAFDAPHGVTVVEGM